MAIHSALSTRLSTILRGIEVDLGSTNMSLIAIESIEDAIKNYKGDSLHDFFLEFLELIQLVQNTKPKFANVIDSCFDVLELIYDEELHDPEHQNKLNKQRFIDRLESLIDEKKHEFETLVKIAKNLPVRKSKILIHDSSRTVLEVIRRMHKRNMKIEVIVAEQDPDKTANVINILHENDVPYRVVPAYMISHILEEIDHVFVGALTLKSAMEFVMDPGSNAVVSQCHIHKIPVSIFLPTSKFSLWPSSPRTEIYAKTQMRKHASKNIEYERMKFSHERVPIHFFTNIVTELGIKTPEEIKVLFQEKYEEREKHNAIFIKDLNKLVSEEKPDCCILLDDSQVPLDDHDDEENH